MPTHVHFILKQNSDHGISVYMNKLLNSYTRYFNTLHGRKGPLWEARFKSVLVSDDEQLLHLTRYIHLNPTSADLVKNSEDWSFSSYGEFINKDLYKIKDRLCDFNDLIDMNSKQYEKFVNDQKSYQRKLSLIKNILIDNYAG